MSIKKFVSLSIGVLLLFTIAAEAQIPNGYYDAADGKTGNNLKAALNTIVNAGLQLKTYGEARNILGETDQNPNNPDSIILVYRGTSVSGEWDGGTTWNREHVWPQSLLGEDASNNTANICSDLQNLKPADPGENSSRGNKYYDNQTTSASYTPRNEIRGDLARILFYMVIAYEESSLDLELVNNNPELHEMAMLDVLLEWHGLDSVDAFELNRNEVIYSHQNNRNPFIDHPEYVELIWDEAPVDSSTLFFSEYIEGSSWNKALEIFNGSAGPVTLSDYLILSNFNNGPWESQHYTFPGGAILEAGAVWVIVNAAADSTLLDVADDTTATDVAKFNGNDVRALVKFEGGDTIFIDVIGLYNDPDTLDGWDAAGITNATVNHTLVRKPTIRQGNPDWSSSAGSSVKDSEWLVYAEDTFDYLGSHIVESGMRNYAINTPLPVQHQLLPNYPNPFNAETQIQYYVHTRDLITIAVCNIRGQRLKTLVRQVHSPGEYRILWDGTDRLGRRVGGGLYFIQLLSASGVRQTQKTILLK